MGTRVGTIPGTLRDLRALTASQNVQEPLGHEAAVGRNPGLAQTRIQALVRVSDLQSTNRHRVPVTAAGCDEDGH